MTSHPLGGTCQAPRSLLIPEASKPLDRIGATMAVHAGIIPLCSPDLDPTTGLELRPEGACGGVSVDLDPTTGLELRPEGACGGVSVRVPGTSVRARSAVLLSRATSAWSMVPQAFFELLSKVGHELAVHLFRSNGVHPPRQGSDRLGVG